MKILIVEDIKLMRDLIHKMVSSIGFTGIANADDGDTALASCGRSMPDIVLLDWEMPRLDGLSFIKALREMERGERVKIIMCTARSEYSDITQALESGADDFIMKPFTVEILASKLALAGAA